MFLSVFDYLTLLAAGLFKNRKKQTKTHLVVVACFLFEKLKPFFLSLLSPGRNEIT